MTAQQLESYTGQSLSSLLLWLAIAAVITLIYWPRVRASAGNLLPAAVLAIVDRSSESMLQILDDLPDGNESRLMRRAYYLDQLQQMAAEDGNDEATRLAAQLGQAFSPVPAKPTKRNA